MQTARNLLYQALIIAAAATIMLAIAGADSIGEQMFPRPETQTQGGMLWPR